MNNLSIAVIIIIVGIVIERNWNKIKPIINKIKDNIPQKQQNNKETTTINKQEIENMRQHKIKELTKAKEEREQEIENRTKELKQEIKEIEKELYITRGN